MGAEASGMSPFSQPDTRPAVSFITTSRRPETLTYSSHQLIPHFTIRIEPLFAAAFTGGRIRRRPIFNSGRYLSG